MGYNKHRHQYFKKERMEYCPISLFGHFFFYQVISFEGNGGFYEAGCMSAPLEGKHLLSIFFKFNNFI